MLENGQCLYLWLGRDISSEFLSDVFGVPTLDDVDPQMVTISFLDENMSHCHCFWVFICETHGLLLSILLAPPARVGKPIERASAHDRGLHARPACQVLEPDCGPTGQGSGRARVLEPVGGGQEQRRHVLCRLPLCDSSNDPNRGHNSSSRGTYRSLDFSLTLGPKKNTLAWNDVYMRNTGRRGRDVCRVMKD